MTNYWPWYAAIATIIFLNAAYVLTNNDKEAKPVPEVCVIKSGGWDHTYMVDGYNVRIEKVKE